MKKKRLMLSICAGIASCAIAQTTLLDVQFSTGEGYADGELAGQNNWVELNVSSNAIGDTAFDVDATAAVLSSTDATYTNASYVYLDTESAGNEAGDEWTGVMDFKLNMTDAGQGYGEDYSVNTTIFLAGLTASDTNLPSRSGSDCVMVNLRVRAATGRLEAYLASEDDGELCFMQVAHGTNLGWNVESADIQDFETDDLRFYWTVRKSLGSDTYVAWGGLTNLNSGYTVTGRTLGALADPDAKAVSTDRTKIYAATDPIFSMGYMGQHSINSEGDEIHVDIEIDSLSVVKNSGVAPVIIAPEGVMASSYDQEVTVTWNPVVEASDYSVKRSETMGGPYTTVATTNGTSFLDLNLMNDTTYYYVVAANYEGYGSSNSLEVAATPKEIHVGTIVDTEFTAADGYVDGNLAGQQRWVWIESTSNQAFNVIDTAGNGAADTVSTRDSFDTQVGNSVYLDKLMDNVEDNEWSGSLDFKLTADPVEGGTVATFGNQTVFLLGLTSDPSKGLDANDGSMGLINIYTRATGNLEILFASSGNSLRMLSTVGQTSLGWDPKTGEDMVTDELNLEWSIRKTRDQDVYIASATVSNKVTGLTYSESSPVVYSRSELYNSSTAYFGMAHHEDADDIHDAPTPRTNSLVHVTIDALRVEKIESVLPVAAAVTDLEAVGSDRTVTLSWTEPLESIGFNIYFSEQSGGPYSLLANQVDATYTDLPRYNGQTNYYYVESVFDADVGAADSAEVFGVPAAISTVFHWDYFPGFTYYFDLSNKSTVDGITTVVAHDTPFAFNYGGGEGEGVYGVLQGSTENLRGGTGSNGYAPRLNSGGNGAAGQEVIDWDIRNGATGVGMIYFKEEDWATPGAVDATEFQVGYELNAFVFAGSGGRKLRAMIRNGDTWYASETAATANGQMITIPDVMAESWAVIPDVAELGATAYMNEVSGFSTANNSTFTNINAVGFFKGNVEDGGFRWRILGLKLTVANSPSSYDFWTAQYGLSGDDALETADPDGDGVTNIAEFGLGGDPLDPLSAGTREMVSDTVNGVDGFIYSYVKTRDPVADLTYTFKTTENLMMPFTDTGYTVLDEVVLDYYWIGVTNFVPADVDARFMRLDIE
ncbi:hypothetical protein [Pontiella agarivorans]|uniref:Fibronectin type III domain-containing protein n=1 Tax=Pontiella agarivorans TaxID=3038953 RepID=A0ABU5MY49_9BACT|nr:hypothetical protein [Pontiella agarivorans]MDZ8119122.1 hypothetical protein [Pontiella agarivorans]